MAFDLRDASAKERRAHIVELVKVRDVSSQELADRFEVTLSTIRRDLAHLAEQGLLLRTLAGAASVNHHHEEEFRTRQQHMREQKRAMAREALTLMRPGMWIYIDAGSSCHAFARELVGYQDITVVTSSLSVMKTLGTSEGIELITVGGRLRRLSEAFYGTSGARAISELVIDIAFLSCDEISLISGLREESHEQIEMKRAVISAAKLTVVLADETKFLPAPTAGEWVTLPESSVVITSAPVPSEMNPRRREVVVVATR